MDTLKTAQTIIEYADAADPATLVTEYAVPLAEALVAQAEKPMRYALVWAEAGKGEQLKAYMPANYDVVGRTAIQASNTVQFLIAGRDSAGFTLDEYVIPRLASGLYHAIEVC